MSENEALEKRLTEARREGLEMAATLCEARADELERGVYNPFVLSEIGKRRLYGASALREVAKGIRALALEEEAK